MSCRESAGTHVEAGAMTSGARAPLEKAPDEAGGEAPAAPCCHWPVARAGGPRGASAALGRRPIPARATPLAHYARPAPLERAGFSGGLWGAGGAALPGEPQCLWPQAWLAGPEHQVHRPGLVASKPVCHEDRQTRTHVPPSRRPRSYGHVSVRGSRLKSLQVTLETGRATSCSRAFPVVSPRAAPDSTGPLAAAGLRLGRRAPAYHVQAGKRRPALRLDHAFHLVHGVAEDELHAVARRFGEHLAQVIQLPVGQTLESGDCDSRPPSCRRPVTSGSPWTSRPSPPRHRLASREPADLRDCVCINLSSDLPLVTLWPEPVAAVAVGELCLWSQDRASVVHVPQWPGAPPPTAAHQHL